MPADVYRDVDRAFGADAPRAHAALEELDLRTRGLVPDRLVRALVVLAEGDADALETLIGEARTASDAVIRRAEYEGDERVRDVGQPFPHLGRSA